jgi:hypothetical protein
LGSGQIHKCGLLHMFSDFEARIVARSLNSVCASPLLGFEPGQAKHIWMVVALSCGNKKCDIASNRGVHNKDL